LGAKVNAMAGQKDITAENLSEPDPRIQYFVKSAETWVKRCQVIPLGPEVPTDVTDLLEVARGAIIYGWFYYPLMTLGVEQCFRCLETAARIRAKQLGIQIERPDPKRGVIPEGFAHLVRQLHRGGAIRSDDLPRWDAGRDMRNYVSHPEQQMIVMPGEVVGLLDNTIELVVRLFRVQPTAT